MKSNKLYIIGNGFDRAHNLPTAYSDFNDWLRGNSYVQDNLSDNKMFASDLDDIFRFSESNGEQIELWSDFEKALGCLNIGSYIQNVASDWGNIDYSDEDGIALGDLSEQVYGYIENITKPLALDHIAERFAAWVKSMPLYDDTDPIYEDIDPEGIFLTFNYTDVLEKVYRVDPARILHIHGRASAENSEIIVGHGAMYDPNTYAKVEQRLLGTNADVSSLLANSMNNLRKNTADIIKQYQRWFDNLKNYGVEEIYLYGLSFGTVDDAYYKEINKQLPNAKWAFAVYAPNDKIKSANIKRINAFTKRIGIPKRNCRTFDL